MRHIQLLLLLNVSLFVSCNGQTKTELGKHKAETKPNKCDQPRIGRELIQDKAGMFWLNSYKNGVYRFDGKSFTNFSEKDGLSSRFVNCILEDKEGMLWFGTADGITVYDGKTFSVIPITAIKGNNFVYTKTEADNSFDFPRPVRNFVLSIMQDSKGVFWLGTSDGIYLYDPSKSMIGNKTFTPFSLNDSIKYTEGGLSIESIMEDKVGNIWFGGRGTQGVYRYEPVSGKMTNFKPDGENWIRPFLQDKGGNIWFMRRNPSVYYYDGKSFSVIGKGEFSDWFLSMTEDRLGNLWFSNGKKGGATCYNSQAGTFKNITSQEGLCNNEVWSILTDSAGNIWFKNKDKSLCRYDGKNFTSFSE